jgi:hypothetical protein
MRGTYEERIDEARKIERRLRQRTDRIVSPSKFKRVCLALWPLNTAATIAAIAGKDERTGARWLAGEFEPPNKVIAAIMVEITSGE